MVKKYSKNSTFLDPVSVIPYNFDIPFKNKVWNFGMSRCHDIEVITVQIQEDVSKISAAFNLHVCFWITAFYQNTTLSILIICFLVKSMNIEWTYLFKNHCLQKNSSKLTLHVMFLGWVSVAAKRADVQLRVFTPGGRGMNLRTPALLPNILAFKGTRITSQKSYRMKKLKNPHANWQILYLWHSNKEWYYINILCQ